MLDHVAQKTKFMGSRDEFLKNGVVLAGIYLAGYGDDAVRKVARTLLRSFDLKEISMFISQSNTSNTSNTSNANEEDIMQNNPESKHKENIGGCEDRSVLDAANTQQSPLLSLNLSCISPSLAENIRENPLLFQSVEEATLRLFESRSDERLQKAATLKAKSEQSKDTSAKEQDEQSKKDISSPVSTNRKSRHRIIVTQSESPLKTKMPEPNNPTHDKPTDKPVKLRKARRKSETYPQEILINSVEAHELLETDFQEMYQKRAEEAERLRKEQEIRYRKELRKQKLLAEQEEEKRRVQIQQRREMSQKCLVEWMSRKNQERDEQKMEEARRIALEEAIREEAIRERHQRLEMLQAKQREREKLMKGRRKKKRSNTKNGYSHEQNSRFFFFHCCSHGNFFFFFF